MLQQLQLLPAEVFDCSRILWFISSFSLFSRAFSFSSSSTLWQKHSKDNTQWDILSFSFFFFKWLIFAPDLLQIAQYTKCMISKSESNPLFFYLVFNFSPFPVPFSLSYAPFPTASFQLMPPVVAPSASPPHPAVMWVGLRPGDSGTGLAAFGAFSPLSPKWYSLAAAVHSEPWSLWTKHKCQLVMHYESILSSNTSFILD